MIMTEEEWYHHCIETGCSMSYEDYTKAVQHIIEGFKK